MKKQSIFILFTFSVINNFALQADDWTGPVLFAAISGVAWTTTRHNQHLEKKIMEPQATINRLSELKKIKKARQKQNDNLRMVNSHKNTTLLLKESPEFTQEAYSKGSARAERDAREELTKKSKISPFLLSRRELTFEKNKQFAAANNPPLPTPPNDEEYVNGSVQAKSHIQNKRSHDLAGSARLAKAFDNLHQTFLLRLQTQNDPSALSSSNIDPQNILDNKPLHFAVWHGNTGWCQRLLDSGADINASNKKGWTPLHLAISCKNTAACKILIANGADINARDESGSRPLHHAASNGDTALCKRLIKKGANINAPNTDGSRPLHSAACFGYTALCQTLLASGAKIDAQDTNGWTALHIAALNRHTALCETLIANDAKIDAQDNKGQTALHIAALYRNTALCETLIEKGADINAQDNKGQTAFHIAATCGHAGVCQTLIEKGADINAEDKYGLTPGFIMKNKNIRI
jgi:ankyrin repeat protein